MGTSSPANCYLRAMCLFRIDRYAEAEHALLAAADKEAARVRSCLEPTKIPQLVSALPLRLCCFFGCAHTRTHTHARAQIFVLIRLLSLPAAWRARRCRLPAWSDLPPHRTKGPRRGSAPPQLTAQSPALSRIRGAHCTRCGVTFRRCRSIDCSSARALPSVVLISALVQIPPSRRTRDCPLLPISAGLPPPTTAAATTPIRPRRVPVLPPPLFVEYTPDPGPRLCARPP